MYKKLEFIIRKKWNEQVTYKLLEDILLRDNMLLAYRRVVTNKGTMLFLFQVHPSNLYFPFLIE